MALYNMLYGKLPFDEHTKDALYDQILRCKYTLPGGPSYGFLKTIKRIFTRDPKRRVRFCDIMGDSWFKGNENKDAKPYDSANYEIPIGRLSA